MDKIDLASYALTAGRTFGSPESVRLARGREPRAFACPIGINAGMQFITKSVSRSVQILDLYPRLVTITYKESNHANHTKTVSYFFWCI